MSEPLPDDLSQWPDDPYELLGVARDVDPKSARRAYLRLIRKYKPEKAPAEFQKIREAFDFVSRQAELREQYGELNEESIDWYANAPAARFASSKAGFEQQPPEDLQAIWEQASQGKASESFTKLRTIYEQGDVDGSQLPLMLYWLSKAGAGDPSVAAIDWLVQGMKQFGLSDSCFELYRREIVKNWNERVSVRCGELLEFPGVSNALDELVRLRWEAAAELHRAEMVTDDLNRLRARFSFEHEAFWGHLLFVAADYVSWSNEPKMKSLATEVHDEIASLGNLAQSLHDEFDRFDLLVELVREGREASFRPFVGGSEWLRVIPATWVKVPDELREILQPMLAKMAEDPSVALRNWSTFAENFPASASQLGGLISALRHYEFGDAITERDWEEIGHLARDFVNTSRHIRDYPTIRAKLFELAINEMVDPQWICQASAELTGAASFAELTDRIYEDGALRWTYQAYRAFHG